MTSKLQAAILIALLLAVQSSGFAETKALELKWNELAPLVVGHRVELTLTGGAKVKGEAVVVREDNLMMDVAGSSGAKPYPKGSAAIPRDQVSLIKVERTRGSWGRSMGTVIGVLSGIVVGTYVAVVSTDSAGAAIPLFLGIASGAAVGGYFAGRGIDRKVTLIRIVP